MSDPVSQVHEGSQQPVDEHQPMPGARAPHPIPAPSGHHAGPGAADDLTHHPALLRGEQHGPVLTAVKIVRPPGAPP